MIRSSSFIKLYTYENTHLTSNEKKILYFFLLDTILLVAKIQQQYSSIESIVFVLPAFLVEHDDQVNLMEVNNSMHPKNEYFN